jgi:hypothetical protein
MAKHLMIDMETMAVSPNAVVLSLGAVHFNPYGNGYGDKLYFRISIDDQDTLGREVDPNTIEWWGKQDPEIMEEAFSPDNRIPLVDAMDQFHKFAWGCDCFWSHGATFDLVIIENIYRQLGNRCRGTFGNYAILVHYLIWVSILICPKAANTMHCKMQSAKQSEYRTVTLN